jgi:hypothetical protein
MKAFVMDVLRLIGLAVIAAPLACVFGACSGATSSGSSSGAGGATTSGDEMSSVGPGGGAAPDAAPPYCPGDAGAWEQLTAGPILCQTGLDCCVIMSPCLAEAQIVAAATMDEASAVWPFCDVACADCIPPAIRFSCMSGACRGRVVAGEPPDSPLRKNHCGEDVKIVGFVQNTGVHFGCHD